MEVGIGDKLIEEQIRRWQLAQRVETERPPPCLVMSRLPGTPAAELGHRIADRLGYGFFGIELVDEVARREHVSRELVAQLDEHVRGALDRWLMDTFRDSTYREKDYLYSVGRCVSALAQKGGAVILGRGASFLLGRDKAFRVQVIEPKEVRLGRLAAAKGLDPAAAQAALTQEEAARLEFLREFVPDPDDPLHFDMVINTANRSLDYWVEAVAQAVERL